MKLSDFSYSLPEHLIAHYPAARRSDSRLLCLSGETGAIQHRKMTDLTDMLLPGDLLVFNDTRVFPARLYGQKASGGRIEILVERLLSNTHVLAHVRASKSPKIGATLHFEGELQATVLGREDALFILAFHGTDNVLAHLEKAGHIPLPPYIKREDEALDKQRYQTVYARESGSVAAPTAGLHFDDALLVAVKAHGAETAFVTLHVGAGTFQPVRVDQIEDHQMHAEVITVSDTVCEQINAVRRRGNRVIAVGTTAVRSLETAAQLSANKAQIHPFQGETDIFIYPGCSGAASPFRCVDAMITNFHLPESTLLMLVSAFAGHQAIMAAYEEAIAHEYRFFSYGDAMFLTRR